MFASICACFASICGCFASICGCFASAADGGGRVGGAGFDVAVEVAGGVGLGSPTWMGEGEGEGELVGTGSSVGKGKIKSQRRQASLEQYHRIWFYWLFCRALCASSCLNIQRFMLQ
jgi:hypothetical protein